MKKLLSVFLFACLLSLSSTSFASKEAAMRDMEKIYQHISIFRKNHDGAFPTSMTELRDYERKNLGLYGYKDRDDFFADLKTPDLSLNPKYSSPEMNLLIPYITKNKRTDGSPVGSPTLPGEHDLICYSDLYVLPFETTYDGLKASADSGNWLVLWDDGLVEAPPSDTRYYVGSFQTSFNLAFQRQVVPGMSCISSEEFNALLSHGLVHIAKPKLPDGTLLEDNGGPESLLHLSRRESYPNHYGIDREELWRTFDPAQDSFSLSDLQAGATKLGFTTQVQQLSLSQLQAIGSSAVLALKDDERILTLVSLDDDRAVVIDRALTKNIERRVLEARYSGEALVPTPAAAKSASLLADDPVRLVPLPSLEAEVPEQITLRNRGTKPVTLQLEYPLVGVTEAKLSQNVVAPGESATLDLKVKWRSILRASKQNVLVSLQTNDPLMPRLQLAFLLVSPPKDGA